MGEPEQSDTEAGHVDPEVESLKRRLADWFKPSPALDAAVRRIVRRRRRERPDRDGGDAR